MDVRDIEFKRLRSFFFSLYEIEQELSLINSSLQVVITSDEYDYISSVKLRKEELLTKIIEILNVDKNKNKEIS